MPVPPARRVLLAVVVVLGALAGSVYSGPSVSAREPVVARTPKPHPGGKDSPSPTPTPTPTPTPSPQPTHSATPDATPSPTASPDATASPSAQDNSRVDLGGLSSDSAPAGSVLNAAGIWWDLRPSFGGTYSTAALMSIEERLRRMGAPARVLRDLYAPFILRGPAQFSDTWGAVRHDHGNKLRPHLGQDVFCTYGEPVLATEPGRIEFTTDRLGGTVVRLHRNDGGYWYYAHLSGYAPGLSSGDAVETGDVIAFCGDSGNASGGEPHVHFGSYPGPVNPMEDLVSWVHKAEERAERVLQRLLTKEGIPDVGIKAPIEAIERCPIKTNTFEEVDALALILG